MGLLVFADDLSGDALNWAVSRCKLMTLLPGALADVPGQPNPTWYGRTKRSPSNEPEFLSALASRLIGPYDTEPHLSALILSPEQGFSFVEQEFGHAVYLEHGTHGRHIAVGRTPLEAGLRCYVKSRMGGLADVPQVHVTEAMSQKLARGPFCVWHDEECSDCTDSLNLARAWALEFERDSGADVHVLDAYDQTVSGNHTGNELTDSEATLSFEREKA